MTVSVGRVRWYGGFDHKKNTENKFGFVEDASGVDVYLHEKCWEGSSKPQENQLVVYTLDKNNGKTAAQQAQLFQLEKKESFVLFNDLFMAEPLPQGACSIKEELAKTLAFEFADYSNNKLQQCVEVFGKTSLCTLLAQQSYWDKNLGILVDRGMVSPLQELPLDLISHGYLSSHRRDIADYLLSLDSDKASQQAQLMSAQLPDDLVCFALLARFIELDYQSLETLDRFVRAHYSGESVMPDYLKQYINRHIKPCGGVIKDEVVGPTFCRYQFKHYLHSKDLKFINLYNQSSTLQDCTDTFILGEIFSLVVARNHVDSIYPVFMGRLWEAISSDKIDITRDKEQILELFPACSTVSQGLSCEAVYWLKQRKFLCRGRVCYEPQVIPDTKKHYLDYSIYDWFSHYGIHYLNYGQPSSRDFPIKLAGYFNRLYEIFEVIHCRECSSLMLPDMRYARVEHTVIENGEYVKKDMAPAYRSTVFKCPNEACVEYEQGHYINHCIGFDCHQLIDDRDIKTKCGSGLYICNSCGSCCAEHGKSDPVGLCPDCGSALHLFEASEYNRIRNRWDRFVRCSNECCSFQIPSSKLNKRFYQPSCEPVTKATLGSYEPSGDSDDVTYSSVDSPVPGCVEENVGFK